MASRTRTLGTFFFLFCLGARRKEVRHELDSGTSDDAGAGAKESGTTPAQRSLALATESGARSDARGRSSAASICTEPSAASMCTERRGDEGMKARQ